MKNTEDEVNNDDDDDNADDSVKTEELWRTNEK